MNDHLIRGLDCLMGYNKTLYGRFIDFNELHIKPWLTKREARTNWLLIKYNELNMNDILDKQTLDHLHAMQNISLLRRSLRRSTLTTGCLKDQPMTRFNRLSNFENNNEQQILSGLRVEKPSNETLSSAIQLIPHENKNKFVDMEQRGNLNNLRRSRALDNKLLELLVAEDIDNQSLEHEGSERKKQQAPNVKKRINKNRVSPSRNSRTNSNKKCSFINDSHRMFKEHHFRRNSNPSMRFELDNLNESSSSSGKDLDDMTSRESELLASKQKSQRLMDLDKWYDNDHHSNTAHLRHISRLSNNTMHQQCLSSTSVSSSENSHVKQTKLHDTVISRKQNFNQPDTGVTSKSSYIRSPNKIVADKTTSGIPQALLVNINPKREHGSMNIVKGLDSTFSNCNLERQYVEMRPGNKVEDSSSRQARMASKERHKTGANVRLSLPRGSSKKVSNLQPRHNVNDLQSIISVSMSSDTTY